MKRGFKTRATKLALEVRSEVGLDAYARFDPYQLADTYGIEVVALTTLPLGRAAAGQLFRAPAGFSGALLNINGVLQIVENDTHAPTRRRSTVSHEMSHVVLEHDHPAVVTYDRKCGIGADQEDEATWLAGELLVPYDAALREAWADTPDEDVARLFGVSVAQARWRMNNSGARKIVERTRRKRGW